MGDHHINGMCCTLWVHNSGQRSWELGYITDIDQSNYTHHHLERTDAFNDKYWRYPKHKDIQTVHVDTLLPSLIIGEWDITSNARQMKFVLHNIKEMQAQFSLAYDSIQ